ncbi:MAG: iron-containing alcohol dehydrogenase [Betaproteobacteria bacterium]
MPGSYSYFSLERVIFGQPAAQAAVEEASRIGVSRVFIVASNTLSARTGVVNAIADALGTRYAGRFDRCVAHSPWPSVMEAAAAVRAAQPDLILTVGGGTAVDTVKILQLALAHDVREEAGLDALHTSVTPDGRRIVPRVLPSPVRQIAVPTTLSGAEFSNLAGGTEPKTRVKHAFIGPDIGPRAVILDPSLTVHTPEWLWLSTGIRALDHAVEAILSAEANAYCDGLSLHALRLFAEWLPRSKADPADLDARLACQQATWLSASTINRLAFGASHGIGHALGAAADVPHGYTSCVMLPHVMRFNAQATRDRQRLISQAMGATGHAADAVASLISSLGLPIRLRDVKVERGQLPLIAQNAIRNIWVRMNPQPIRTPDDVMRLLEAAW